MEELIDGEYDAGAAIGANANHDLDLVQSSVDCDRERIDSFMSKPLNTIKYITQVVHLNKSTSTHPDEVQHIIYCKILIELATEDSYHMTIESIRNGVSEVQSRINAELQKFATTSTVDSGNGHSFSFRIPIKDLLAFQAAIASIAEHRPVLYAHASILKNVNDTSCQEGHAHDLTDHCFVLGTQNSEKAILYDTDTWILRKEEKQSLYSLITDMAVVTKEDIPTNTSLHGESPVPLVPPLEGRIENDGSLIGTNSIDSAKHSVAIHLLLVPDILRPEKGIEFEFSRMFTGTDANGKPYQRYEICLRQDVLEWRIEKRYTEFLELHEALKKQAREGNDSDRFALHQIPKFTGKNIWKGLLNPQQVQLERKLKLTEYLQALLHLCQYEEKGNNGMRHRTVFRYNNILLSFLGMLHQKATTPSGKVHTRNNAAMAMQHNQSTKPITDHPKMQIPQIEIPEVKKPRNAIHLSMLANMAGLGDLVLFRCKNSNAVLQRLATGSEFDHTGIVVHKPLRQYWSDVYEQDEEPLTSEKETEEWDNTTQASSAFRDSFDKYGMRHCHNSCHYMEMSQKYMEQELYLLEASAAGITMLPLLDRLRAYEQYHFCEYICLRKLNSHHGPTYTWMNSEGDSPVSSAGTAFVSTTIDMDDTKAESTLKHTNPLKVNNTHTTRVAIPVNYVPQFDDGFTSTHLECFPFHPYTIYRLNSFLLTVQGQSYGFKIASMLFAPKRKYKEKSQSSGLQTTPDRTHTNEKKSPVKPVTYSNKSMNENMQMDTILATQDTPHTSKSLSPAFSPSKAGKIFRGMDGWSTMLESSESNSEDEGGELDEENDTESSALKKIETRIAEDTSKIFYSECVSTCVSDPVPAATTKHAAAEVQVQGRTFFCSALTAATMQVLCMIPASYNDSYFWPGNFASGGLTDSILAQVAAVTAVPHITEDHSTYHAYAANAQKSQEPAVEIEDNVNKASNHYDIALGTFLSHGNAMNDLSHPKGVMLEKKPYTYRYSYEPELFIDCRVPEIETAILVNKKHFKTTSDPHASETPYATLMRPAATFSPTFFS